MGKETSKPRGSITGIGWELPAQGTDTVETLRFTQHDHTPALPLLRVSPIGTSKIRANQIDLCESAPINQGHAYQERENAALGPRFWQR
jgi:hypothetical protein